jgi:hypothetical protein
MTMTRLLSGLAVAASITTAFARTAGPTDEDIKKKPITTGTGEVGKLLTRWWKEGTAAGNA